MNSPRITETCLARLEGVVGAGNVLAEGARAWVQRILPIIWA